MALRVAGWRAKKRIERGLSVAREGGTPAPPGRFMLTFDGTFEARRYQAVQRQASQVSTKYGC